MDKEKMKNNILGDEAYLSYKGREIRSQKKMMKNGLFFIKPVVNTAIFICLANDFLRLQKTWRIVETTNPITIYITALTCALLLDLSMTYFGIKFKDYTQSLINKAEMTRVGIIAFFTFIIPYLCYFLFTMSTKTANFTMSTKKGFVIGSDSVTSSGNSSAITYIAIFAAILPLATSLFSILVGFCTRDKLTDIINELNMRLVDIRLNMMDVERAIAESDDPNAHRKLLIKYELNQFKNHIEHIYATGVIMKIKSAELIAHRINTPEAYSELISVTQNIIENNAAITLPEEVQEILMKEGDSYEKC